MGRIRGHRLLNDQRDVLGTIRRDFFNDNN